MQRPDDKKRGLILSAAARLFATQPFHKVRLDDIAAAAKVGKGTVYIYFANKDDLYFSLIYEGFSQLVDRLRTQIGREDGDAGDAKDAKHTGTAAGGLPAERALRRIVREFVGFAFRHPHYFELMRTVGSH